MDKRLFESIADRVSEERLVETACSLVEVSSPTGSEQAMGERMLSIFDGLGLDTAWQQVEDGRPNVVGTLDGVGGGPTLMFNGHMDTSYSGREPWLRDKRGFRPEPFVTDDRIYGLGISNMKGALACYVEAVRAIRESGVQLRGDLMIAAVTGEIEKTQWGEDFRGAQYRGYAAGSRYLPVHGAIPDYCVLGEPTEQKIVLGHYGSLWGRISTHGPFVHTAFSAGRQGENSIVRMQHVIEAVLAWAREWEEVARYEGLSGLVNIGSIRGGFPWRARRTPTRTDLFVDVRVPPKMNMAAARRAFKDLGRQLAGEFPDYGIQTEVYLTAPGAEIEPDNPLVGAIDRSHSDVFGAAPERDRVHWFSDASALTRYGIQTVNYGTSSGLPGEDGESLEVAGLVQMARVYALVAARMCEVAS